MNAEEFIEGIKLEVRDASVNLTIEILKAPTYSPTSEDIELSEWFNSLSKKQQAIIELVVRRSVDTSIVSFLCVLDGATFIEDGSKKGKLKLWYEKDGERTLLNNAPHTEELHNLY